MPLPKVVAGADGKEQFDLLGLEGQYIRIPGEEDVHVDRFEVMRSNFHHRRTETQRTAKNPDRSVASLGIYQGFSVRLCLSGECFWT